MGRTDAHHGHGRPADRSRAGGRARDGASGHGAPSPEERPRSPQQGHLEARLRRAIQMLLARGLNDPRIRGLVSVTEVELVPDRSRAIVHVSVLPEEAGPLTVAGLRHAAPRLAAEVGAAVRTRRLPALDFQLDDRLKTQAALDAALIAAGNRPGAEASGADPERTPAPDAGTEGMGGEAA